MRVYRITRKKYSNDLSGEGARLLGGRWNPKGSAVLYAATNSSLAMLETLVHIPPFLIPEDLQMIHLELPISSKVPLKTLKKRDLPLAWKQDLYIPQLQDVGLRFIQEEAYLGLEVPSVINDLDTNVVLNVNHPAFAKVKIVDTTAVVFDKRLL